MKNKIPERVGTLGGNWAIIISPEDFHKNPEIRKKSLLKRKEAEEWIDRQRRWPFNCILKLFKLNKYGRNASTRHLPQSGKTGRKKNPN